jgi:hypothetical protein
LGIFPRLKGQSMEVYCKDVEKIFRDYPGNEVVDLLWINLDFWYVNLSNVLGEFWEFSTRLLLP